MFFLLAWLCQLLMSLFLKGYLGAAMGGLAVRKMTVGEKGWPRSSGLN